MTTTLSQSRISQPNASRRVPTSSTWVYRLRSSRSIASMLPSMLLSGVITLVMTAVMHLMLVASNHGFFSAWMESWLITWPIAFPVVYLIGPAVIRLAARISAPAAPVEILPGIAFADIDQVSASVTERNGFTVLRNLKPAQNFNPV